MINKLWAIAPEWALDIRDGAGKYGIGLIFTNQDKRYCEISNITESDYVCGDKDHIGLIFSSKIISCRPVND